jgi:hypothetical protein
MMPTNLFRRLRGAASLIAVWSVGWGIVGSVAGGLLTTLLLWSQGINAPVMGLFFAFGVAGAIAGAVSGAAFALAVTSAGRTESLAELSAARLGFWSALPAFGGGLLERTAGVRRRRRDLRLRARAAAGDGNPRPRGWRGHRHARAAGRDPGLRASGAAQLAVVG